MTERTEQDSESLPVDFERSPDGAPLDETDVSLRAYFSRLSDEHLAQYDPSWDNRRVIEWDGNFRSDGNLMLVCCERDVDVEEFRRVLEEHLSLRKLSQRQPGIDAQNSPPHTLPDSGLGV